MDCDRRHYLKKNTQLGMSFGTAYYRLLKIVIFDLVVKSGQNACYHCGRQMCKEDFSLEHKVAWLNNESPMEVFLDINNISFSHIQCNRNERSRRLSLTPAQREESKNKERIRKRNNARKRRLK